MQENLSEEITQEVHETQMRNLRGDVNRAATPGERRRGSMVRGDGSFESEKEPPRVIDTQHRRSISPAEAAAGEQCEEAIAEAQQKTFAAQAAKRRLEARALRLNSYPRQIHSSRRRIMVLKASLGELNEKGLSERMCAAHLASAEAFNPKAKEDLIYAGVLKANIRIFRDSLEQAIQKEEAHLEQLENTAAELRAELGLEPEEEQCEVLQESI